MTRKTAAARDRLFRPNQAPVLRKPKRATEKGVEPDFKVLTWKSPDGERVDKHGKPLAKSHTGMMPLEKPPEPEKVVWPRLSTLELSRKLVQHSMSDPSIDVAIRNVEIASEWVNATLPRGENAAD